MQKFNLTKDLFEFEEQSSDESASSVIYVSSDDEREFSDSWDSEWSTETEAIIDRIEREVKASPILIGGRIMTTENLDDEMQPGASGPLPTLPTTPELGHEYFDRYLCYAPSKKPKKSKIFPARSCQSRSRPCRHLNTREDPLRIPLCYTPLARVSTLRTTFRMFNPTTTSATRHALAVWYEAVL